jgi:hypothetical protein
MVIEYNAALDTSTIASWNLTGSGASTITGGRMQTGSTSGNRGLVRTNKVFKPWVDGAAIEYEFDIQHNNGQCYFGSRCDGTVGTQVAMPANGLFIRFLPTGGNIQFIENNSSTGATPTIISGATSWVGTYDAATWYRVRIIDTGNTIRVFVDNTLVMTTVIGTSYRFAAFAPNLYMCWWARENGLSGHIYYVRNFVVRRHQNIPFAVTNA